MTDAFLGLKVLVILHSGVKLEGTVSQLEASTHQMTLKDGNNTVDYILFNFLTWFFW
jgi:hypothetical protein